MNLPNYFLVDLPPEASLNPAMISEACQTLKRNRAQYLESRSTPSLIRTVSALAADWLNPGYSFRQLVLAADPAQTGFSRATLAAGLDSFFQELTADSLHALLEQDLGHAQRLDKFCSSSIEHKHRRAAMAQGPEFLVHIAAGTIPIPLLLSMILGLLLRSAQFVKCASGAAFLPRIFAHSLYEAEPKLGACLELAEWPGGQEPLEAALFAEADCITATGSDETIASIRHRLPTHARMLGYGHRVSFGYIAHQMLSELDLTDLVARAALDIVAWNQLGCLSPHLFYVERGGRITPEEFAEHLAKELLRHEQLLPRGPIPNETAAVIAQRRAFYEVRAAHSLGTRQWCSSDSTAWTVVYESDPRFQLSCLHRFVYVKEVANLTEALQGADSIRRQVSTVGLAAPEDRVPELAKALARWGALRICPIGKMQQPPLSWRHDGRSPLADLVTWTDLEQHES